MRQRAKLAHRSAQRLDDDERAELVHSLDAFTHDDLATLLSLLTRATDAVADLHARHAGCLIVASSPRSPIDVADIAITEARQRLGQLTHEHRLGEPPDGVDDDDEE